MTFSTLTISARGNFDDFLDNKVGQGEVVRDDAGVALADTAASSLRSTAARVADSAVGGGVLAPATCKERKDCIGGGGVMSPGLCKAAKDLDRGYSGVTWRDGTGVTSTGSVPEDPVAPTRVRRGDAWRAGVNSAEDLVTPTRVRRGDAWRDGAGVTSTESVPEDLVAPARVRRGDDCWCLPDGGGITGPVTNDCALCVYIDCRRCVTGRSITEGRGEAAPLTQVTL